MEKRFLNYTDFYNAVFNNSEKNYEGPNVKVPPCINTDFCIQEPMQKNNGVLTMAFVDMQPLDSVYSMSEAFCKGTLFPNLNKPWEVR